MSEMAFSGSAFFEHRGLDIIINLLFYDVLVDVYWGVRYDLSVLEGVDPAETLDFSCAGLLDNAFVDPE